MKAAYASLILGLIFLTLSFFTNADAMDINAFDTYFVIAHSIILHVIAAALFLIAFWLYRKHRPKKVDQTK